MELPRIAMATGEESLEHCFGCGEENPIGLKLRPVFDGEKVVVRFTPGEQHQGWSNVTHGGILYSILDEITAYAVLCAGYYFGVTAKSSIRFKSLSPTDATLIATAWVTRVASRLVETRGRLETEDGTIVAEVESIFLPEKGVSRAFLWDMDGVIVDSAAPHFQSWRETLAAHGATFTEKQFGSYFGTRNDYIIGAMLGPLPDTEVKAISEEKEQRFRDSIRGNARAFPGTIELLRIMKKGNYPTALATSAPRENVELVLTELGLSDLFDVVLCGQDVTASKPSPDIYLRAAERLQVDPRQCVVFEDSPRGVPAAKRGGMKCVAVSNSRPAEELEAADRVVSSLKRIDLIELIRFI